MTETCCKSDSPWAGFGVVLASILLVGGAWVNGFWLGQQRVTDDCANYQRYKIPQTTGYMNCFLSPGVDILPNSTEGKKR